MNDIVFIGIDPGLHGAVAFLHSDGSVSAQHVPLLKPPKAEKRKTKTGKSLKPKKKGKAQYDEAAMARLLFPFRGTTAVVAIEAVSAGPQDGRVSAFRFGTGYGLWLGMIAAYGLQCVRVRPAEWRPIMVGVGTDKAQSKVVSLKLYPKFPLPLVKDEALAEAILIARYVKDHRYGKNSTHVSVDKSAIGTKPFRSI